MRKVGYYDRVEPAGLRVPYWYCPKARRAISMLPDFAASHVSATLAELEVVVERFEDARRGAGASNERAAARAQPELAWDAAMRSVNRRRRWVRAALAVAIGLLPVLAGCEPSLASVRAALGGPVVAPVVLVRLRELAAGHLAQIPAPLGFGPLPRARDVPLRRAPHSLGPAPPRSIE